MYLLLTYTIIPRMDSNPITDNRIRKVISTIPPGKTVLDIGCAQNPDIHFLIASKSKKAVAIDINKKELAVFVKKGLEAHEMSAEDINLPDRFDYIVAGELIEHLSNPGKFLEGIRKHLKTDGKILLTTPNISSIFLYLLVVVFDKTQDHTHTFYFDKKNLETLLSRYQLKIKNYDYIPPEIKLHGKGIIFRLMFFFTTFLANFFFHFNRRLFGSYLFLVLEKQNA